LKALNICGAVLSSRWLTAVKTYLATKCQEKKNLVHEEDISCQKDLFVEFKQLLRNLHIVPGHRVHLAPSGVPFQHGNVLPQLFMAK
jgi:hypothetical protein